MSICKRNIFIIIPTFLLLGILYMVIPTRTSQAVVENTDISNWHFYQSGIYTSLEAIWGWPDNTVIAAGYYSSAAGGYLIYRFNGSSWSESIANLPNGDVVPNYGYISDLWGVSSDDVYAVTRGTYRDSYGGYYCGGSNILHYNGTNWQVVNNDSGYSGYTSIWGTGSSDIYVTGLDCGVTPFVSHWNGTAWTSEDLTFALNYESSSNDIHGNASGDIYIAGEWGIPKHETAEYTNWPDAGPTEFGTQWQGIWVAPDGHVFVVAYGNIFAHYDGASWEKMEVSQGESFNKVWGFSSSDVYAVGYDSQNNNGTWSTEPVIRHFNGTSWSKLQIPSDMPSFSPNDIWGTKTGDIFVVGSRGVLSTATMTSTDDGETDYPLVKERCDAECGAIDPNSEWDGLSLGDCECKCKEDYHVELESVSSSQHTVVSHNTFCASNDCRQLCNDLEWYEYKSGSVDKGDCECSCVPGAERNMYGHCRPPDDLWTFLDGEDCGENTYPTERDIAGTAAVVCTCDYGFANCDRHPYSGCETNIRIDKFNCGYCGKTCSNEQQCYNGSCVSQEYYDAVASISDKREQTEWEEKRKNNDMQVVLSELETNILKNEFENLWGIAGELFDAGSAPSVLFDAVTDYFNFIKKRDDHFTVQLQIDEELLAGNITPQQARMITELDAVLKASSVLSGFTGRDAMYQQGVLIDTATDMVINEALRSAKYKYCSDIIIQFADYQTYAEEQALNECLHRQVSAGVFR